MPAHPLTTHQRQIHLDFHTSPFIGDVGVEFDATTFAKTLKAAHINSVTVFAKCHHGMCYYPTKHGTQHPALNGRDLMGEQIEALHREGIRAPIYTTVVWEENVANLHPEWRQMTKDGYFAGWDTSPDMAGKAPGIWKFNNFLHPDYIAYYEDHLREICKNYEVDGFFHDILFFPPGAGWDEHGRKVRAKKGWLEDSQENFDRLEGYAQSEFVKRISKLVKGLKPKATYFYNSSNDLRGDTATGPRVRQPHMTHFELESLPSGFWGYQHYPRLARAIQHWGQPWMGMTGRFQKMWGDFGGIKPQPALEYECFRAQSMGGASSVGDQLPPRGTLDQGAYDLIGAVYAQWEDAEPFYANSTALPQVGVATAAYPGGDHAEAGKSEEGAVQLCEEAHYDAMMVDEQSDLSQLAKLDLIMLTDTTVITPKLKTKLKNWYAKGGKLIVSYKGGCDANGEWALDFLPIQILNHVETKPTYWRSTKAFSPELAGSDRVFYQPGLNVKAPKGAKTLVQRVLPYFPRTDLTFSSHFQTPPVAKADKHPAIIAGDRWVYFADPLFREYRQSGNLAARLAWTAAMERLIGPAPFGAGLSKNILIVPRRKGKNLLLTLLHYIPVRKALDIDVIDERGSYAGEAIALPAKVKRVRVFGEKKDLAQDEEGKFLLPPVKGRLLLEVPNFF